MEQLVTLSELTKDREWSRPAVDRILGEPDETRRNRQYRSRHPIKLYRLARVIEAEAGKGWRKGDCHERKEVAASGGEFTSLLYTNGLISRSQYTTILNCQTIGWELVDAHRADTGSLYLDFRKVGSFRKLKFRVSNHQPGINQEFDLWVRCLGAIPERLKAYP